uniref:Lysosomal acid phosphatase n=1 Tax=Syphacia muris TaxID=451379 RepID=A0A0N5AX59_9BILA
MRCAKCFVFHVWRHGDRAPVTTYPTDIYNESIWRYGWGELTELGMKQQYALGRLIRKRYITDKFKFISPQYDPKEIYIRSSDVNRAITSALSNLAAMYPLGRPGVEYPHVKNESWPSNWTPIPVHTVDFESDHALNIFAKCERAKQLEEIIKKSEHYQSFYKSNKDFLNFLSSKTTMAVDLDNVYLINDVHIIEKKYNLSQPDWLTDEVSNRLNNLTRAVDEFKYGISKPYMPELIKLRGGSLLKLLIENMKQKIQCETDLNDESCQWYKSLKFYAFSAHDTTVAALLTTLGDERSVLVGGLPDYTASISFELWEKDDIGYAVKILFHPGFHHNYRPITRLTKGCSRNMDFCPFKQFEKRSRPFIPKDIVKDCQRKKEFLSFRFQNWRKTSL